MNVLFLLAAAFAMVLASAHSYLGERYILIRLFRRPDLPRLFGGVEFTKRTDGNVVPLAVDEVPDR